MREYQIFTDATSDLQEDLESVKVIPMNVEIGDKEYVYGPQEIFPAKSFTVCKRGTLRIYFTDKCTRIRKIF